MTFLLRAIIWTCLTRLFGRYALKQKYTTEDELGVFIVTFVIMSSWLLLLDWIYE